MIINKQYPHLTIPFVCESFIGTVIFTSVPCPGAEIISSLPITLSALSFIVCRPNRGHAPRFSPDECEPDCDANGQADVCDLDEEGAEDCDGNGILDECQTDCNANGRPDVCDLDDGTSDDCNFNEVPDECEVPLPFIEHPQDQQVQPGEMAIFSVEVDIILPAYQWRKDGVDLEDTDRIIGTTSQVLFIIDIIPEDAGQYDCVVAELGNECIATSDPATLTVHGPCPADFDDDGAVGPFDLAFLLGHWGPNPGHPADLDADGTVGPPDLAILLGDWGPCP